jgi:hypothetical protein
MMVTVGPSKTKKWRAQGPGWTVNFGAKGYENYTMHHNKHRKALYIQRHQKRENWSDPKTAGFWSRWLLWEEPSLTSAARAIKKRFGISVSFNKWKH